MTTSSLSFRRWSSIALVLIAVAAFTPPGRKSPPIRPDIYRGLVWRNIGPFRGGRISAVTGAVGQSGVFYAGLPLGGVWKTTSAGITWYPIFDAVKEVSSVGSIQVAPSDPNIIYVGMGDLITGGGINEGNGIYKSIDAGKTWQHLGMDDTKQIPAILVDPRDPNTVLIAAQGDIHQASGMRGVFRSTDGGKNWLKTLYVDSVTGGQNISWAYDKPEVMLAATVRHYTPPVVGPRVAAGGPAGAPGGGRAGAPPAANSTHLYKSSDEGVTWTEITGHGLPTLLGRICTAVAANTNGQRMFVIGTFGLYRSDDGGATWRQMDAADRRIANGQGNYTSGVYVDPKNPDIIYTLATSSYRSLDGGSTFAAFKGAPGGDDPQQMWIDQSNGQRLFLGVDQGATVSLDGGQTWSPWYNQATGQIYHLSVDNSYPYWVYGTQQDAGSYATRSRGDLGAITPIDWLPNPGYEFGSIVADPLNPKIVYAGGPSNGVIKITYPSGQWMNISPNIDTALALRKVGNQPLQWSETNPHELMIGYQYLMSTTDGGVHWKKLSPDLGYPKGYTPPPRTGAGAGTGGPPAPGTLPPNTPPGTPPANPPATPPVPFGGSIESIATSSVAPGVIWVGTNNGLVKVTKNHGVTWEDVSIADLPNPTRADIQAVDASHHDPATAYVAVDYHTMGDYKPYFYRTRDYGRTWTKITSGLPVSQPSGSFARVIRADRKKAGLLFAGTESSVYVSFDDGDNWQSLMLNLPNTSYRDMVIKGNDLVVATYGRGFWILDDISPLRQITAAVADEPAHLFQPGDAIRVRRNVNGDTPFPPEVPHALNPPLGVVVYYFLGEKPSGDITLEVLDAAGNVVRHMSSAPIAPFNEPPPAVPDHWLAKPMPMPTAVGTNRINWNMRYDDPPAFTHTYEINANEGETNASPEGPLALPGTYTLRLTVDGKTYMQKASITNDPRSPATMVDLRAQHDLQMKIHNGIKQSFAANGEATALAAAVGAIGAAHPGTDIATAASALQNKITAVAGRTGGGRSAGGGGGGGGGGNGAPPSFTALNGSLVSQLDGLDWGDMAPNEPILRAWSSACSNLRATVTSWNDINAHDVVTFNALLAQNSISPVVAVAAQPAPVCGPPPATAVPPPGVVKK